MRDPAIAPGSADAAVASPVPASVDGVTSGIPFERAAVSSVAMWTPLARLLWWILCLGMVLTRRLVNFTWDDEDVLYREAGRASIT
jgi:hypothetical protein